MTQAISGVVPPSVAEATVMTVWPSVGSTPLGRALGRLYRIKGGLGPLSVGRLALLATIPLGLMLYLSLRLPWAIRRYRLTNRRVSVERGLNPQVEQYVDLDRFDTVDLVVQPGQEWYDCGDLVFRRGPIETLRLQGVSRPEPSGRRASRSASRTSAWRRRSRPEHVGQASRLSYQRANPASGLPRTVSPDVHCALRAAFTPSDWRCAIHGFAGR